MPPILPDINYFIRLPIPMGAGMMPKEYLGLFTDISEPWNPYPGNRGQNPEEDRLIRQGFLDGEAYLIMDLGDRIQIRGPAFGPIEV